jgi:hypothetical protein
MAIICVKCPKGKNKHPRGVSYFRDGSFIEYCRVHDPANLGALTAARNLFEGFTVQHVHDENHKPIKVNSVAELRAAEKKYNFALAVMADDGGKADTPPKHCDWAGDISHGKPRVWNRDPSAYQNVAGVSTGLAADPKRDTLLDLPNATT